MNPHLVTPNRSASSSNKDWLRALARTASIEASPLVSLPVLIQRLADRFEEAPALSCPMMTLSYRALAQLSNRYARWALSQGLSTNDVVALLMPNRADYLAVWLGISRSGATVSLINSQLVGDSLVHALTIVGSRHVIVAADLAPALLECRSRLASSTIFWSVAANSNDGADDGSGRLRPIEPELAHSSGDELGATECPLPSIDQRALFIYTSGTTGLPKAAQLSHYRLMQWSHWFAGMMDTGPDDRMYNCLPLYHSVGGIVATGATLLGGGTVIVRSRFSATDFWRDVREQRCTLFQYIGELCRYLVNRTPPDQVIDHSLRLACGNGLRADVWPTFRDRFKIPKILEYYAATEGNFSLYNCEQQPGSIGRIPGFLAHRLAVALVKVDPDSGEPIRDSEGFCQPCDTDEIGAALGRLPPERDQRNGRFEGYADPLASDHKLLRHVFDASDVWYQTGDLMRRDQRGFYYFVDRLGDTYRWKGENVSTTEVMAALAGCTGVLDGVVYGVSVAGADGRVGMAALIVAAGFDWARFHAELGQRLPDYARPAFVRVLDTIETTTTHRPRKLQLMNEGFDPTRISDPIHVEHRASQTYVRLDTAIFEAIGTGDWRL